MFTFYQGEWIKELQSGDSDSIGDIVDTSQNLAEIINTCKEVLQELYDNQEEWSQTLQREHAVDLNIEINSYLVEDEYSTDWESCIGHVFILNGKAVYEQFIFKI